MIVQRMGMGLLTSALILSLCWSGPTLSRRLGDRPVAVRLGFTPPASILKATSGEHRYSVAELIALKVLFYFGSLVEESKRKIVLPPEYVNMYQTLETVLRLDPYNADVYYFSQAVFTWEIGRAKEVNRFLDHGMKYRTWDPMLPFFAGFNAAYFLHDYDAAAIYMRKAAEMTNNPAMARLASRYFYEAGRAEFAVNFLEDMARSAPSKQEAELYQMRRDALLAITEIEKKITQFQSRFGRLPTDLPELVNSGILEKLPVDPYGGSFYLDKEGHIRSSSNLAFQSQESKSIGTHD